MEEDDELYEKFKKDKSDVKKIFGSITTTQAFILTALFVGLLILISVSGEYKNARTFAIILAVAIGIIIFYFFQRIKTEKFITLDEARIRVFRDLKKRIGVEPELPTGTKIRIGNHCTCPNWQGKPYMWYIQVFFQYPESSFKGKITEEKVVLVDCYTGDIRGIRDAPLGFQGDEEPDIQPIFVTDYRETNK